MYTGFDTHLFRQETNMCISSFPHFIESGIRLRNAE